jgi:hypothetical protein
MNNQNGEKPYHEHELSPFGGKSTELFNLRKDPGEKYNLADELPEIKDAMYQDILSYREKMGAQMPEINPEFTGNYQSTTDPSESR